jgi:hypothetical protein
MIKLWEVTAERGENGNYYAISRAGPFDTEIEAHAAAWHFVGEIEVISRDDAPTLLG